MADYTVSLVRREADLAQLEEAWASLLCASQVGSIFASFAWNMAWWHAFGKGHLLNVLVASDATGVVRGIAPLMRKRSDPLRRLEIIGSGLSDKGDFLLDATCAEPVAASIFAFMRTRRQKWDLLDLDEVPPYSPLASSLETHKLMGLHVVQLSRTDCPFVPLPATWEEYIGTLQRKPRQHLEGFARRVIEETGASFRLVTKEEDVPAAVERFYSLHLARWASKEDTLNPEHRSPAFLPFLREVCLRSASAGLLRLAELWIGDKVVSSWISFQVNGRLSGYMTGFDPEWSSKRPGKILHRFVVQQALAEGVHELDFGRGAEEYKFEMGAVNRMNQRFVITNNMPSSALALGLMALRIKGRDLVHRRRHVSAEPHAET